MTDFGNTNVEALTNPIGLGGFQAYPIGSPASDGNVTSLSAYVDGSAVVTTPAGVGLSLYKDNGSGYPGLLVGGVNGDPAQGAATVAIGAAAAWVTVSGLNLPVLASESYWIAVNIGVTSPETVNIAADLTGGGPVKYGSHTYNAALPNPFPGSFSSIAYTYSVYATYGPPPPPSPTAGLEAGVRVQASQRGSVVSIVAVNHKYRLDRVTELEITLPASVAGRTPVYYLIDSGHSDLYDSSPDDGTLQSVDTPAIVAGTITLQMQPRSVHLLQFDLTGSLPPPDPPTTLLDSFDRGSAVRGVALGQVMSLTIGKVATGVSARGVAIAQAPPPPETWPATVIVEIALGNPTSTPTWTTVPGALLLGVETQMGRNFELDRFEAGTCTLLFNNADRRWDPLYTSGAYYPNLKPLRRMRVRAGYGGGQVRPLFDGYIERINLSQTGRQAARAEVHLVDGFEVLANANMATPTPTFTLVHTAIVRLDAVGPWRGSLSVTITDTHADDSEEFQATCDFSDEGVLTFNKRRSHSTGSWQSSLNTSDLVASLKSNPRAAAVFKATVLTPGWIGGATGGTFTSGWAQENATARINRALNGIGWSATDRALDTSSYQVQAISFQDRNGVKAKQVVDDAASSELGLLYLSPDGKVVFKKYNARQVDAASVTTQLVLTDSPSPAAGEFSYTSLTHEYSRDRIYNDIMVEVASAAAGGPEGSGVPASGGGDSSAHGSFGIWQGGGHGLIFPYGPPVQQTPKSASAEDLTSQAAFWPRSLQISTSTASPTVPGILAAELLRRYKDEHQRISSVTVTPIGQPGLWPHVLARQVNDRVLVKWTPPGGSQQLLMPCWIESVKHSASGHVWETEWGLSPVI